MDNYDPHAPIGAVDDPLILYGFENLYAFNGAKGNDSAAVTSGELTEEQQKACVGARESLAWSWNEALDTYQHNPLVFNDSLGNGISWARRSIVRIRIQTKDLDPEQARLTVRGVGTMMERVGMAGWTPGPNVVEVAYNAFVRKGWGKGTDPARMDADSWAAASNYCAYEQTLRQTTFTALSGTDCLRATGRTGSVPRQRPVVGLRHHKQHAGTVRRRNPACLRRRHVADPQDRGHAGSPREERGLHGP